MQPCLPGRKAEHFYRAGRLDCYRTDAAPWQGCLPQEKLQAKVGQSARVAASRYEAEK